MNIRSLTDILKGGSSQIHSPGKRLDDSLIDVQEANIKTVSGYGLKLVYDPKRFDTDLDTYVSEQLALHQTYYPLALGELSAHQRELHQKVEEEGNIERPFQYLSEDQRRMVGWIGGWIGALKSIKTWKSLKEFKTPKERFKEKIEVCTSKLNIYRSVVDNLNYGKSLIDERLSRPNQYLSETARNNLMEWVKVQGELTFVFSRVVSIVEKQVQAAQRTYQLVYPNSNV